MIDSCFCENKIEIYGREYRAVVISSGFGGKQICGSESGSVFASCVILGKCCAFSEPQFLHPKISYSCED